VHGDLVEEVAGVEGGFTGGLDEADDAFGVRGDEEREVGGGELGEGRGGNDKGRGAAELFGGGLRWLGLGWVGTRRFEFCEGWFRRAFGWGGDWRGRLREEGVEVDFAFADAEEGGKNLLGQANTLGAPVGEEEENGGGAVVGIDARGLADSEERKGEGDGGERCAKKSVLTAGFADGDGVVGFESCRESGVQFGYGFCGLRITGELLERGEGEAVGVEGVDGDGRLGCRRRR